MLHPSKILIVDDDPCDVDLLELELEDLGYVTVSASNGREALEKVAVEAPDLILLDVMMPIMDGLTACRLLKEDDETRLIPIVFMTGLDSLDDRIKGIEAGADDFLTKPVHQRELLARMQTTLRLKQTVEGKLRALRQTNDHFAKFVPEAVKRLVAANPAAPALAKHVQDVSVLFLDITGYTRLCEQWPLEVLNRLVERYFSTFLDQIYAAGGDINETAGDGFMAIFQAADVQAAYGHGGGDRTRLARRYRSAQSHEQHAAAGDPHGAQLGACPSRFDPLRGGARDPLDLYGERPGDEPGGASGHHCPGRSAPGRSRDRPPLGQSLSGGATRL
jgi:CheY-like chemotaxis protein